MYVDPSGDFPWLLIAAILLFTPIGGTIMQVAVSLVSYTGASMWAIGDLVFNGGQGAWKDMNSINWNPFNTDESSVLASNYISFYKGVPVFRYNGSRSGSFYAIFLTRGASIDDLKHERGHNWQAMMMGVGTYGLTVGIPSPLMLGPWGKAKAYYSAPWETLADILGGVQSRTHNKEALLRAWLNYGVSFVNPVAAYLFLLWS